MFKFSSQYKTFSSKVLLSYSLFGILILFASCSKKIQPEQPSESYISKEFQPEISHIAIPIEIEIAKLNAINRVDAARIAKQKGWL